MYKDGCIHCPKNIMSEFDTIFIKKKSEILNSVLRAKFEEISHSIFPSSLIIYMWKIARFQVTQIYNNL